MSLIKLTLKDEERQTEKQRIESLRRKFIEANKEPAARMVTVLEKMAETNRPQYEAFLAELEIAHVEAFIVARDRRSGNMTIEEFNRQPARNKGEDDRAYMMRCATRLQFDSNAVMALTDHPRPANADDEKTWAWMRNDKRPAFKIALKQDAQTIAAKRAKEKVDQIVRQFIFKTMDKVIDVLVHKPQYTAKLVSNNYGKGVLEADIFLTFVDGTSFRTHLILKTNYRYGSPYMQYPMTFHDWTWKLGESLRGGASHYEIMKTWNIPAWQPPVSKTKRRRWDTVKSNCVIMTTDNRLALVERIAVPKESKAQVKEWNQKLADLETKYNATRGGNHKAFEAYHKFKYTELPALKLGLTKAFVVYGDGNRAELDRSQIAYIAAKMDSTRDEAFYHDEVNQDPSKVSLGHVYVEYADGEVGRVQISGSEYPDLKGWTDLGYSTRPKLLRGFAFKHVVENYTTPEEQTED